MQSRRILSTHLDCVKIITLLFFDSDLKGSDVDRGEWTETVISWVIRVLFVRNNGSKNIGTNISYHRSSSELPVIGKKYKSLSVKLYYGAMHVALIFIRVFRVEKCHFVLFFFGFYFLICRRIIQGLLHIQRLLLRWCTSFCRCVAWRNLLYSHKWSF